MGELDRHALLAALRRAAEDVIGDRDGGARDLDAVLGRLVHSAVNAVSGADGSGISRTEHGTVRSSHATSEDIVALDQLQSRLGQGPCITAADDPPAGGIVLAADLDGDDARRWPAFAPAAVEAGYRCLLSVQLSVDDGRRSALNLYARAPGAYDESAQFTAGLFALQAAILLHGVEHAAHLGQALHTRDVIGQAKGILMERFTVDDNEAFQMLVNASQDTNVKLSDVARWLTGEATTRREELARDEQPSLQARPDDRGTG